MILDIYNKVNQSYNDAYIYKLGDSAGFYSEYNNMILAMLWCLENKKRFTLQSKNANFSTNGAGWNQFFKPFITEVYFPEYDMHNTRYIAVNDITDNGITYHCMKTLFDNARNKYVNMNADDEIILEDMQFKGTLKQACAELHKMIWHYNDDTKVLVYNNIDKLSLPETYNSMHIRLGDKYTEHALYNPSEYINALKAMSDKKDIFIFTDDYNVINYLNMCYSGNNFYTLCQPDECGYSFIKLNNMQNEDRLASMIRMFASMDIIADSMYFVGTYSTNPDLIASFYFDDDHMKCLDYDYWKIW